MKNFNYVEFALMELEEAKENYKKEKIDIDIVYYRATTLIYWLGALLDKKKDEIQDGDKQICDAVRFAWNVVKHDKRLFEIGQKAYILNGICGRMRCGQGLNPTNSVSRPTIIWKDLDDTDIRNMNGKEDYDFLFKNAQLDETMSMIKNIIEKYCSNT